MRTIPQQSRPIRTDYDMLQHRRIEGRGVRGGLTATRHAPDGRLGTILGQICPYEIFVGTVLGAVLAISLSLLSADAGSMLLHAAVVFLCVQVLEGWVITPKVVGESVGLSSFAVIVSVLFFGELLGFVGVLVAVPLAAILKILLRVFLEQYRQSSFFEN